MAIENIIEHNLSEIIQDFPGVTIKQAAHHLEACLICLNNQEHVSGVQILVKTHSDFSIKLSWNAEVDEYVIRSWGDLQEATEYGATALAILMILKYSTYTIVERSAKGTGFDYYLLEEEKFDENAFFPQASSRLEVSGILKAKNDNEIKTRVTDKIKQTKKSDGKKMSALIIVAEFGRPEIHMVKRA